MMRSTLADRVCQYTEQLHMLPQDTDFLCGVSGGADSVALLLIMKEIFDGEPDKGRTLRVVHVEHGIRGKESVEDADFTAELCRRLQLPFQLISVSAPEFAEKRGIGLEEAARILRYDALRKASAEHNSRIVLAHHIDDNAETILFQLARGCGLRGLCGIHPVRTDDRGCIYIRPLLCTQKKELEKYLEQRGQSWRTDSTNSDLAYSRNRVRGRILPELEYINPQAAVHISRSGVQLAEAEDFLHLQMLQEYGRLVHGEGKCLELDLRGFSYCHPAIRKELLLELLETVSGKKKDFGTVHIDQLMDLCNGQSGKTGIFPYGLHAVREFDRLLIYEEKAESESNVFGNVEISAGMLCRKPETLELSVQGAKITLHVMQFDGDMEKIPKNKYTKWFDYDKIKNGFCIRTRESGDYLISDSAGHRKKLKRYFIDEKVPVSERDRIMLAAYGKHILWVIGGRISEDVKVVPATGHVLELIYTEKTDR